MGCENFNMLRAESQAKGKEKGRRLLGMVSIYSL